MERTENQNTLDELSRSDRRVPYLSPDSQVDDSVAVVDPTVQLSRISAPITIVPTINVGTSIRVSMMPPGSRIRTYPRIASGHPFLPVRL